MRGIRALARWSGILLAPSSAALALAGCQVSAHFSTGDQASQQAAEQVFATAAGQGADAAYAQVSPTFRRLVGPNAWRAFAQGLGLAHYERVAWRGRTDTGQGMRLDGMLEAQGAVAIPITVTMGKAGDGWQMDRIEFHKPPTITVGEGAADPAAPPGTPTLAGGVVADACSRLLTPSPVAIQISCMQGVPARAGAEGLCVGITPRRVIGITAHVNSYNPVTQDTDLSCRATDPDRPAATGPTV